jgi:hypothetical protein
LSFLHTSFIILNESNEETFFALKKNQPMQICKFSTLQTTFSFILMLPTQCCTSAWDLQHWQFLDTPSLSIHSRSHCSTLHASYLREFSHRLRFEERFYQTE